MVSLWLPAQYSTRSNSATINFIASKLVTINKPYWTYNSQQTKSFNRMLNASYLF